MCLRAIASIFSVLHAYPKTCTAIIAFVFGVIAFSILSGSIVKLSASISTNTGVHLSHNMEETVATYENGVVIISPSSISRAFSAS